MKKITFFLGLGLLFLACKDAEKSSENDLLSENYQLFGAKFSVSEVKNKEKIGEFYSNLKPGDTLEVRFTTTVNSVCKKKGCWMVLNVPEEEVRVSFKDYGFFMPKDIENREVVVSGKAFVEEMSVEDQQHYAKDAGKNEAAIAAITQPELSRSFIAEGVLLKE